MRWIQACCHEVDARLLRRAPGDRNPKMGLSTNSLVHHLMVARRSAAGMTTLIQHIAQLACMHMHGRPQGQVELLQDYALFAKGPGRIHERPSVRSVSSSCARLGSLIRLLSLQAAMWNGRVTILAQQQVIPTVIQSCTATPSASTCQHPARRSVEDQVG